jgi:4-hydroxybenzoate polyprenyltransferase
VREARLTPTFGAVAALARPFTLLAPVVGVLGASAVAAAALDRAWLSVPLLGATAAAALATAASNAWNQVFDLEIDRVNKPHRPLPSGAVASGLAMRFGFVCAVAALGLAALVSPTFLACVAVGVGATWLYSGPPLRLKRRLVGALLAIAVPRGLLVPVAGWAVISVPDASDPWALGIVAFLFVLGAAATKDFSDVPGDRAHGCRTLPVVLGVRRAAVVVAPFLVFPFVLYPVFGALGWLHAPIWRLTLLAGVLVACGFATAFLLLRDVEGLAHAEQGHPAWRGMYLLLLGTQVGTALVYAF